MGRTLHPTTAIMVVGNSGNFPNPKKLVNGMQKRRVKLEAVVRCEYTF